MPLRVEGDPAVECPQSEQADEWYVVAAAAAAINVVGSGGGRRTAGGVRACMVMADDGQHLGHYP